VSEKIYNDTLPALLAAVYDRLHELEQKLDRQYGEWQDLASLVTLCRREANISWQEVRK